MRIMQKSARETSSTYMSCIETKISLSLSTNEEYLKHEKMIRKIPFSVHNNKLVIGYYVLLAIIMIYLAFIKRTSIYNWCLKNYILSSVHWWLLSFSMIMRYTFQLWENFQTGSFHIWLWFFQHDIVVYYRSK